MCEQEKMKKGGMSAFDAQKKKKKRKGMLIWSRMMI
jgi:hypothetical protein